jgi:hypothetical protein
MSLSHDSNGGRKTLGTLDVQVGITREQGINGVGVYPMKEYSITWISYDDDELDRKRRR